MSEHQLPATQREKKEDERPDADDRIADADMPDEVALRVLRNTLSWKEWVKRDFLRYWYWLAALLVDISVPWAVAGALKTDGILLALVVGLTLLPLVFIEALIYTKVWPVGPWTDRFRIRRRRFSEDERSISVRLRRIFGR